MKRAAAMLVVLALGACGGEAPAPPAGGLAAARAHMNRGLAALEKFVYPEAAEHFERALAVRAGWTDAQVNLAISLLNIRGDENHRRTEALCREILAKDPRHPHANFILGFLLRMNMNAEGSLRYFDAVIAADPADPAAHFWKGMALGDLQRYEESDRALTEAIRLNPYLGAAYYARHSRLRLLRQPAKAEEMRALSEQYAEPKDKPFPFFGDLLTAGSYHEIGKYALAIRNYAGAGEPPLRAAPVAVTARDGGDLARYVYGGPDGAEFTLPGPGAETLAPEAVLAAAGRIGPGPAAGDFDGDGDTDLYLPEWGGPGRLYRNDGRGIFADVTAGSGIATPARGISAVFFDADLDADLDLFVAAAGPCVFYRNDGNGTFSDRTKETGLAGDPDVVHVSALPGDFDHEGDLDLFVAGYCRLSDGTMAGAPDALFRNNRDGTFVDVAADMGVAGGDARSIGALAIDCDRDLDTDLLVLRDRQPAALWRNERVAPFRAGDLPPEVTGSDPVWGAAAGDVDRDGIEEVLVLRGPGAVATLLRADPGGAWRAAAAGPLAVRWRTGVFLDADLDGFLDLVGDDIVVLDGRGGAAFADRAAADAAADTRGMAFGDFDGDGSLDRVVARRGGATLLATAAPPGNRWLALRLLGRENLQPAAWAPPAGPDPWVEVRAGDLWQSLRSRAASGFLGTLEAPLRIGLGDRPQADVVRIIWPDRVLQVEAEVPANQVRDLPEVNRKQASCPMFFVWDGERFRFASDLIGVGVLGFLVAPGTYAAPDPDEVVRIGSWPKPVDGDIVVSLLEPFAELTYCDDVRLVVADHPAGMTVYPEERYSGERALFPSGDLLAFAKEVPPAAARDAAGRDVLDLVAATDRRCTPVTRDPRFLGVAEEHAVTFDFTGRVPVPRGDQRLVLVLEGWLEYGYSADFLAAWQAGVPAIPPCLERPDGNGGWETVVPNIGCPAGITKSMTWDVTGIVTPDRPVFRIRTNFEAYWDRVFLGVDEAAGNVREVRVAPRSAVLRFRGYPREYSPDGREPWLYDYSLLDPGYPFRHFAGDLTRFGDVLPLVLAADDRYVVMGHGEEILLRFPVGDLPPPGQGMARTYLLHCAGWCKDMDPATAHPDTVEPLPFRGMSAYPYGDGESYPAENRAWLPEWNTRRRPPR